MAEATISKEPAATGPFRADLGMILGRSARRFGSRPALITDTRTFTYAELDEICDRAAGGMHALGVRPGDRVSLYSPNRWEWVVAYHAALRLGAGTTGHPKGAMQSHRAVFLNTAALFAVQTRTERDVLLIALPLPHVYGNVVMNGTFMAGGTLVMMERWDAAAMTPAGTGLAYRT